MRGWRALKATGRAAQREGVYLLPAATGHAAQMHALTQTIREGGAHAHLLHLRASDTAQEQALRALFDRCGLYAEPALRKHLRTLDQQLQAFRATDHFPAPAALEAGAALDALRTAVELRLSPGEPGPADGLISQQSIDDDQGRSWATRRRPWVDRLATAWLVQRHIDRSPRFMWLDDARDCPPGALGYGFDVVSFAVVAASFGLDADLAVRRIGDTVHAIDIGALAIGEAPGVEALVRGLQARHADDDLLLAAASMLFDTLYAALRPAA